MEREEQMRLVSPALLQHFLAAISWQDVLEEELFDRERAICGLQEGPLLAVTSERVMEPGKVLRTMEEGHLPIPPVRLYLQEENLLLFLLQSQYSNYPAELLKRLRSAAPRYGFYVTVSLPVSSGTLRLRMKQLRSALGLRFYSAPALLTPEDGLCSDEVLRPALSLQVCAVLRAMLSGETEEQVRIRIGSFLEVLKAQRLLPDLARREAAALANAAVLLMRTMDPLDSTAHFATEPDWRTCKTMTVLGKQLEEWLLQMVWSQETPESLPRGEALCAWLKNRVDQLPGLDASARMAGTDSACLQRWFQREKGMTYGAFVRQIRRETAAELLEKTSLSVPEVAVRTGYQSVAAFSSFFRRAYGLSPRAFRRQKNFHGKEE